MNVAQALASILKREGVKLLFCYPTTQINEEASLVGIRPVVVRQERTGLHMADAYSRLSSGQDIGVFAMQHGPGTENSYGGIAQAYAESAPILVLPQGYPQRISGISPNYGAALSMRDVTKSAEVLNVSTEIGNVMRRAFTQLRTGRGGPVLVEVPSDVWAKDSGMTEDHVPVPQRRYGPDPEDVRKAVDLMLTAKNLVIHAGQGVHYARAWDELKALAELLGAPVATTLPGKSAFPENHPLSLGSGGLSYSNTIKHFLTRADVILGVGCSFTETVFAFNIPRGERKVIHITLDPAHLNKDIRADVGLLGDAKLALQAILTELKSRGQKAASHDRVAAEIAEVHKAWLAQWMPKLTSNETPLSPYRVLWDLMTALDGEDVILTHDAGRPRDQLTPFWISKTPQSFIGWGKTTQLGYGLGLAMGAKLARPEKLCVNIWGDAAIGFTGMDIETAVRERIPVLSILLNNKGMATEHRNIPNAIKLFQAADISGDYADMAKALGAYGERVTSPDEIVPAIRRGVQKTREGKPVLLEFMTAQETAFSQP